MGEFKKARCMVYLMVYLVYAVPTHVTFSYENKINQEKVEAKSGGILSLLFKFLMRIIKGKWG